MRSSRFYLIVIALHLLATSLVYGYLPLEVPLIWTIQGDPDAFLPKPALWFVAVIPLFAYLFMALAPKLDTRSEYYETQENIYLWGARSFLTLYLYLYWVSLAFSLGISTSVLVAVKAIIGIIFIVIGSYLYRTSFRSKLFWAIRTPWSELSEANWKKIHRFSGWLLVLFGLSTLLLIFAPRGLDVWVFLFLLLGYIFSYIGLSYFLKKQES